MAIFEALYEPVFEETEFILVAPNSPSRVGWNPDVGLQSLLEVLDHVQHNFSIDTTKIIISGYSMGGIMAWHAVEYGADRFAGAIPISGRWGWEPIPFDPPSSEDTTSFTYTSADVSNLMNKPFYVINSRLDLTFIYEKSLWQMQQLQNLGIDITFHIVDDLEHTQVTGFIEHLEMTLPWINNLFELPQ